MTTTRTRLRLVSTFFGGVIALVHLVAFFYPSGTNWGFHHLAFLPPPVSVTIVILMLAALAPQVQERLFIAVKRLTDRNRFALSFASVGVLVILFWLLRQKTFFLGDGYLVLRNLSRASSMANLPAPFPTAPLSAFVAYQFKTILAALQVEPSAQLAWQVQSIACGVVAIPVAFRLAGALVADPSMKWPIALFLLAGGATQLFCGYVETYPPAYVATMVFLWLSLDFLAGKCPAPLPFLAFGVLFTLHFGMVSLLPAVAVLFFVAIQRKKISSSMLGSVAAVVFIVLILWMCSYSAASFFEVMLKGGSYFLPLTLGDTWQAAYSLFSLWHVIDFVNAHILLSPYIILLFPFALPMLLSRSTRSKPETIFLALTMLAAIGWTFVTNFEVGMSRDWDVLAPLSVCVVSFSLFGTHRWVEDTAVGRQLLLGMALVTLLHTVAWVAVNSDEGRSIVRFAMLQDSRLRSQRAVAYACEDLAGFYRDRRQFAAAIPFMEKALTIDSTNARRWLSLAHTYQLAGDDENAKRAYEESARWGIQDKAAFFNLGILYYNRRRLEDAIVMLRRAAAIDSADTLVSSNLKMMCAQKVAGGTTKK